MTGFVHTVLQPFSFPFMQQALLIAVLIAVPMAMLSSFLDSRAGR
jgi:manganese/iron transport system permease protein